SQEGLSSRSMTSSTSTSAIAASWAPVSIALFEPCQAIVPPVAMSVVRIAPSSWLGREDALQDEYVRTTVAVDVRDHDGDRPRAGAGFVAGPLPQAGPEGGG